MRRLNVFRNRKYEEKKKWKKNEKGKIIKEK